ncbi:MAG TPA: hypothetical protein VMN77_06525 [Nitrospiria bacterium]|jgi:hypothetical protein|nr:hypothetical protein [Nitrospiria bacterium]
MRLEETIQKPIYSTGAMIGVFCLLVLIAAIPSFRSFIRSIRPAGVSVPGGTVQEEAGFRIVALARFDQERHARLQEQWDKTLQQYTAFENGRQARQQELLGQSIANTAQTIWMKQEGLKGSIIQARAELQRFNEEQPARWQEKLGMAAVAAFRNAPEGGEAFLAAFQHETDRLHKIQGRILYRLESDLGSLTAQQIELRGAIPVMYSEAIHSANRSAEMMEASETARVGRIFGQLQSDLSWKRTPEDYVQQVAVVREIQRGQHGAGGFVEYGLWAVAGLVMAMVWAGSTITKDPINFSNGEG